MADEIVEVIDATVEVVEVLNAQGPAGAAGDTHVPSAEGQPDGKMLASSGGEWIPVDAPESGASSWSEISDKPAEFPPASHEHAQADVTGLAAALDGKADAAHSHDIADVTGLASVLDSKANAADLGSASSASTGDFATAAQGALADTAVQPSEVADVVREGDARLTDARTPTAHAHPATDVTGLTKASVGLGNVDNTADAAKPISTAQQAALDGKANATHSHAQADVTGLTAALAAKADASAGVPVGGTSGQVLAKASATDHDTEWVDPPAPADPEPQTITLTEVTGTGSFAFPVKAIITPLSFSAACRLRIYRTAAGRTTDAARAAGVERPNGVGLLIDYVATGAETWDGVGIPCDRASGETVLYYNVTDGTATIDITYLEA